MSDALDALLEMYELKDELRTGWVLRNVESPESVAAHTWGTATLCLLYAERAGIDREKAVTMALVHDLAEARTGDIPTRAEEGRTTVSDAEKEAAEREALTDMLDPFEKCDVPSLWEEYEARDAPTARFVKDMDLIDNCLQALKYEREGRYDPTERNESFSEFDDLDEFFATAAPRFGTQLGEALFEHVKEQYEQEIGRPCRL